MESDLRGNRCSFNDPLNVQGSRLRLHLTKTTVLLRMNWMTEATIKTNPPKKYYEPLHTYKSITDVRKEDRESVHLHCRSPSSESSAELHQFIGERCHSDNKSHNSPNSYLLARTAGLRFQNTVGSDTIRTYISTESPRGSLNYGLAKPDTYNSGAAWILG